MADASSPSRRRFEPEPVETTVKKSRKFAVEPVETTTRSNRTHGVPDVKEEARKKEFAPPKRRFIPEPVETSFKSSKKDAHPLPTPELTPVPIPHSPPPAAVPKIRRRFTPQLIETSTRSKKQGDKAPATLPTDKTDITPGTNHIYVEKKKKTTRTHPVTLPPSHTSHGGELTVDHLKQIPPLPPRRQGSMRPHPNTRRSTRQNSFLPELEPIISEEGSTDSENSDDDDYDDADGTPSLSNSIGSSEDSLQRLQLARTRESCDDRFSGYLLALAAKAAEKQLREQALAAFPNSDYHEIVEHFYDRELEGTSDDGDVEGIGKLPKEPERQATEVGWAVKEMQAHQEKLNRFREEETNKKIAAEASAPTFKDPFWTNGMTEKTSVFARANAPDDKIKEAELERMRSAASPPMLGGDLKFRMCPSPKATKFESDQRFDLDLHRSDDGGGLWGGYCVAEEAGEYISPSGHKAPPMLQTPNYERDDPFATSFCGVEPPRNSRPSSRCRGMPVLTGLDERLQAEMAKAKKEEALLEEFDEGFVTQVYNYLSLGYPALAWAYDEELAKISEISIEELRKDDNIQRAKGHIGVPDKVKESQDGGYCPRWKALRLYILEWARQNPGLENTAIGPSAWGVRARRDSWGI